MAIIFYNDPVVRKTSAQRLALRQLYSFIDINQTRLARFLNNMWREQEQAITYKQIREAILAGEITPAMVESWQQSYSRFVSEHMLPKWEEAFRASAVELKNKYPAFAFDGTAENVRQWNMDNAARFVTNSTTEQIKGLRAAIRRATDLTDAGMNVDELSRVIRPMVGLTDRQTRANLNYYQKLIDNGMKPKKAQEKSIRYSARQHRYRAQMIARTELAFSYNQGQFLAVKQAQEQNLMGKCRKQWVTADTERTCSDCISLDGKEIEMEEDFDIQTNLKGSLIKRCPPAHPHCMCAINYIEVEPPEQIQTPPEEPEAAPDPEPTEEDYFTPAKSIKEANEYARDVLGIPNVDYKGTTVDIANEWNRGLADNFRRFPELKKNFQFVGTCQNRNKHAKNIYYDVIMGKYKQLNPGLTEKQLERSVKRYITKNYAQPISSTVYAQSTRMDGLSGVTISKNWQGESFLKSIREDVALKFHPEGCDTVRSILDHEIGHQIDDLLDLWDNVDIIKLYRSMTPGEMTNKVSRYAWDNSNPIEGREFIAECWSEYVNNPTPRETAKAVGEIIEEEYRKFIAGRKGV